MKHRFVALAALALCAGVASAATAVRAQQAPAPAPTPVNLPSLPPDPKLDPYARAAIDVLGGIVRQQIQHAANSAQGTVTYYKRFDMQVMTGPNAYRSIRLHQGTVINPRGESIVTGQRVDVGGVAQNDGSIDANVITILQ